MVWKEIFKWCESSQFELRIEKTSVPHETSPPKMLCPNCETGELQRKNFTVVQAGIQQVDLTGKQTYECKRCEAIVWEE